MLKKKKAHKMVNWPPDEHTDLSGAPIGGFPSTVQFLSLCPGLVVKVHSPVLLRNFGLLTLESHCEYL